MQTDRTVAAIPHTFLNSPPVVPDAIGVTYIPCNVYEQRKFAARASYSTFVFTASSVKENFLFLR